MSRQTHIIPLIILPFPLHSRFTEHSVLPLGLCGRVMRYKGACRLKCVQGICMCVPE